MKRNLHYLVIVVTALISFESFSQGGSPDLAFGEGGKIATNFFETFPLDGAARAVVIQPDNKIVVAGTFLNGSKIYRFNEDGSPDNNFGNDGSVFIYSIEISCLALQIDGKIVVAGGLNSNPLTKVIEIIRFNPDGSIDSNFNGKWLLGPSQSAIFYTPRSMAIQADGKIVVAGERSIGIGGGFPAQRDFFALRYNVDGSHDNSFDGDGLVTTDFGSVIDQAHSVAIQADGKILLGGAGSTIPFSFLGPPAQPDFAMVRYNADGSLDSSFDGDGKLISDVGIASHINVMTLQAGGKILMAGSAPGGFVLARYNPDGSLDESFDDDGIRMLAVGNSFNVSSIVIQTDGKFVVAGSSLVNNELVFTTARFEPDGGLDNSFDNDGIVTTNINPSGNFPSSDNVNSIAIQADGGIIVAGESVGAGNETVIAIAGYHANGSLDNNFDGDGILTRSVKYSVEEGNALAVQTDGKIVVAGYNYLGGTKDVFAIARYNTDESLDNSFDGDGKLITEIGNFTDRATAVAIQSDGRIVVAGTSFNGSETLIAIARYNIDGSLDNSFDGDGKLTTDFSPGSSVVTHSIAIQMDGKILVASTVLSPAQFALARYNTDGSLDNSFDGDGKLITIIGTSASAHAVTVQPDGKIIVVGNSSNDALNNGFTVVRYNTDGSLDNNFDGDGKLTTPLGFASSVALQADGKILVAGNSNTGTQSDFAMVRYHPDGILDNSFDEDGIVTTDVGFSAAVHSVAIQADGRIVLSGSSMAGFEEKSALVRYNADGSIDPGFGFDGKVVSAGIPASPEYGHAMKIFENRIYVAGYTVTEQQRDFLLAAFLVQSDLVNIYIIDPVITEGDHGNRDVIFELGLSQLSDKPISLQYHTVDGTAQSPKDYIQKKGKLTFPPFTLTQLIRVKVKGDRLAEGPEQFTLVLSNPVNAVFLDNEAVCTILDDDSESLLSNRKTEPGAGNKISVAAATGDAGQIIVSPNPANQALNLRLWNKAISGKLSVELIDQNGRIVKQWVRNYEAGAQLASLPIADIPGGTYIVVIKDSKGKQLRQQVVVAH